MVRTDIVALFGETLFMDMVEACLSGGARVGVVRIHPSVPDVAARLQALRPCGVIVDFKAPNLDFILAVLSEQPPVPIFCLDVTCNQVVVLMGQPYTIPTVDHLLDVIERHTQCDRDAGRDAWSPQRPSQAVQFQQLVDIQAEGEK